MRNFLSLTFSCYSAVFFFFSDKSFKLRNEGARLKVFFLHAIMSRLQEESKAKEDASAEKTMSVLGRIPSQEMKSTSIYENGG